MSGRCPPGCMLCIEVDAALRLVFSNAAVCFFANQRWALIIGVFDACFY